MGHSSIQVTVDIYGHLVPGANVAFVDRLDETPKAGAKETQTDANRTQTPDLGRRKNPRKLLILIGGGGWTRTSDLRIMRPSL